MESQSKKQTIINNKYILEKELGHGNFGTVYKAKEKNGNIYYAAKVIMKEEPGADFEREVKVMEKIKKTNNRFVIKLINSGHGTFIKEGEEKGDKNYIIMEIAEKCELYYYKIGRAHV